VPQSKFLLDESRMPTHWYNIAADLPVPLAPPLHPGTLQPVGPDDLAPLFPMALILQEVSTEREIPIPEPVREVFRLWRPSPLFRAHRLEQMLGTPAKIFYKYEGVSPAGSHKPNTAVPQAFYNAEAGVRKLTTETGAGQWGSSLAFAGSLFGVDVKVFQVRVSYDQKPYRRALMETYGARCVASPSSETASGRAILAQRPDHPGSLGIAISEAVEIAATHGDTNYALGSVLNHVLLHQTIVGQEAMLQLEMAGADPDVIVGCTGGGSNFAGISFPFLGQQLRGGRRRRIVAVEPAACPSLTRGRFAYDFGDTAHLTPLTKMHTLGSTCFHKVVDCQWACPAHTPVPEYIRLIAAGRTPTPTWSTGSRTSFPASSGAPATVPANRPAGAGASRKASTPPEPVAICRLKRVAADNKGDVARACRSRRASNGKRIACIGAGPASLTVARDLAPLGYESPCSTARPRPAA
jgi:tryptophan synthase beta chain